jgi:single-stranded-DNA-specific exonuclease
VVSLTDENRVLVQSGLKVWRRSRRIGLKALAKQAGISLENVTSTTLGFIIGPRINASGRLSHAKISLELIMTTDKVRADELANKLEELNTERRLSQKQIEIEAKIQVNKFENDEVLVLSSSNWPQGIIGIVASRLMENYQKPVFIMQELGLSAKGSARSFGDFSAVKALDSVKNLLTKGGGHDAAAGFTIKSKNIKAFRTKLNQYYNALKLKQQSKFLISSADMSLRLQDVSVALINRLRYLEPYGNGNLQPLFLFDNLKISEARLVGDDNSHLRLVLTDDSGQSITGIYFRFSLAVPKVGSRTAVIARLSINDFNNQLKTQLEVERLEEKLAKNASVVVE